MLCNIALAGNTFADGLSQDGRIRNLSIISGPAGVEVSFSHEESADHGNLVYLNGSRYTFLENGNNTIVLGFIPTGYNTLAIDPIRTGDEYVINLISEDYGRTARLFWNPSSSEDTVSYNIYQYVLSDYEQIASLSGTQIRSSFRQLPDSGTGTGTISVSGEYFGPVQNKQFSITIYSDGYTHDCLGSESDHIPFLEGQQDVLPFGISLVFNDPANEYIAGDVYNIYVGPPTTYRTEELSEGTHLFKLSAVDSVGNESSLSSAQEVLIMHRVDSVVSPSISWDGSEITLTWTDPNDPDLDGVDIFSNFRNISGTLDDYIYEDEPFASVLSGVEKCAFTPSVDGVYKFYIRANDADGRDDKNYHLLSVDTSVPTNLDLNEIEQISGVGLPSGKVKVLWQYNWSGGEDCTRFYYYLSTVSEANLQSLIDADTPYGAEPYDAITSTVGVFSYEKEFAADFTIYSSVWIAIKPATNSVKGYASNIIASNPDGVAPSAPSGFDAMTS